MSEDEVIDVVANKLRQRGFVILAEGANQGSAFRFQVASRRSKAPDLVAFHNGTLVVMEGKIRARDLFVSRPGTESDFDCLTELAGNPTAHASLMTEAQRRLEHSSYGRPPITEIRFGLIAIGLRSTMWPLLDQSSFALIRVSDDATSCSLEPNKANWADGYLF